jgi:hypothetical protein
MRVGAARMAAPPNFVCGSGPDGESVPRTFFISNPQTSDYFVDWDDLRGSARIALIPTKTLVPNNDLPSPRTLSSPPRRRHQPCTLGGRRQAPPPPSTSPSTHASTTEEHASQHAHEHHRQACLPAPPCTAAKHAKHAREHRCQACQARTRAPPLSTPRRMLPQWAT